MNEPVNSSRIPAGLRTRAILRLVERADLDHERRSAFRRTWRLDLAALAAVTAAVILAAAAAAWLVTFGLNSEPPLIWSPQFFAGARDLVAGKLDPDVALKVVAGALAVNSGIALALVRLADPGGRRSSVATSDLGWSKLHFVASVMSLGAVLVGIAVWTNIDSGPDVGSAAITTVLAGVTALWGTLVHVHIETGTDRACTFAEVRRQVTQLSTWSTALAKHGVPRPLHLANTSSRYDDAIGWRRCPLRRQCVRACAYRLVGIALLSVTYAGLVLGGAAFLMGVVQHQTVHWSWKFLLVVPIQVWFAVIPGYLVGFEAVQRWTKFSTRRVHWRLDVRPRILYAVYAAWSGFVLAGTIYDGGVVAGLIIGGWWVLAPATIWISLWASRRWPANKLLRDATWPVWALVELSLYSAHTGSAREQDRLECEEAAELMSTGNLVTRLKWAWTSFNSHRTPAVAGVRGLPGGRGRRGNRRESPRDARR